MTQAHETGFKCLVRASLNEASYDEIERVLIRNAARLHEVATAEMLAIVYDRRVIAALASRRCWIHLQLLAGSKFLARVAAKAGPSNCPREVELVVRQYLVAKDSPLRLFALSAAPPGPSILATAEERDLVRKTFEDHRWYQMAMVERPLFALCKERLDSGRLDRRYNQRDDNYTASAGISWRWRCPLFLAEKAMRRGFEQALEADAAAGTATAELWWLFMEVFGHSRYLPEQWGDPDASEHPTPLAYLLWQVCSDLWDLLSQAYSRSGDAVVSPGGLVRALSSVWAHCVVTLGSDARSGARHVSPGFAEQRAEWYLRTLLEWKSQAHDVQGNEIQPRAAWAQMLLVSLREKLQNNNNVSDLFVRLLNGMDLYGKPEEQHRPWLESELNPAPP